MTNPAVTRSETLLPRQELHRAIQVAGVVDQRDADLISGAGVEFIGFPLRLRDGREDLDESAARRIIRSLPPTTAAVAITYVHEAVDALDLCNSIGARWVQLHGDIPLDELARLRSLAPWIRIIKSLIVRGDAASGLRNEMTRCTPYVDAFITDTYDPRTGRTGATGLTHDWRVSRSIVAASSLPVILAGGLDPDNVRAAIREVRPAAVDVHTGIEGSDGRKDPERLRAFVDAAREAFANA